MGTNDTPNLGLRRPQDGNVDWGNLGNESINHNFGIIDKMACPSDSAGDHALRIVAQSFAGISVPAGARLFGSIQDAIDDVPYNRVTPSDIKVYPGVYSEELLIEDKSVHIYSSTPFCGCASGGDQVHISSNSNSSTATGRACVKIGLRTGKDDSHPSGQTPSEFWALPYHQHDSRRQHKIVFSNIYFDNYGKYYLDQPHDSNSIYYLDATDNGIPPYYQNYTWITFNNCGFRGQTWRNRTVSGHAVGWYQSGFSIRAYSVFCRFIDCFYSVYDYGGGQNGREYLPVIRQPFKVGTDGTSFISWYMGPPGSSNETVRFDGNPNSSQRGYNYNKSSIRWMNSDFYAAEKHGIIGSWAPTGYAGTGWWWGHGSDSSCAFVTLFNMGGFHARGGTFYPSAWGEMSGYGPDPSDDALEYSNYRHLYTDDSDPSSVIADVESVGQDVTACSSTGLKLDGVVLSGNIVKNSYGVEIGGYNVRDPG